MTTTTKKTRTRKVIAGAAVIGLGSVIFAPSAMAEEYATTFATVSDHAPHGSDLNDPENWCEDGWKLDSVPGDTYVLDQDYEQVIVKAGGNNTEYANTIFAEPPSTGEIVWADTNGNGYYDDGDKDISHIIFCPTDPTDGPPVEPPPVEPPPVEPPPVEPPPVEPPPVEPPPVEPPPVEPPTEPGTPPTEPPTQPGLPPTIVLPEPVQPNPEAPATEQPTETLPHTGASAVMLGIAAALLAGGTGLVVVARRQQ